MNITNGLEVESDLEREFKEPLIELRLYIAGQTVKSLAAIANLKRICDEHFNGRYLVEIVDLLEHPQRARGDQIVAIPTLVKKLPIPLRKVIGDLSNVERVLVGLDIHSRGRKETE